ncbi:MAG: peptidase C45 [Alphaproteobacteria bacterium]|nr:peptidase C45 [Alphaproteobacteria bacterium]
MLPNISIEGDEFDIGIALGRQTGGGLRALLETVGRYRKLQSWQGSLRLKALEAVARAVYPQYVRTLEGLAEGAGMTFDEIFLWNCRGDLLVKEDGAGTEGCTSVLIPDSAGRGTQIAHNEDGEREFDGHCFLASILPRDGIGFMSFCYPGLLPGHAFAVNDRGLVQTINHIPADDMKEGIPRHMVTRAVIGCGSLDEALAILQRPDRASAFNHNLMQTGDRRVLSVEAPAHGCDIEVVSAPYAHANHLLRFPDYDQTISPSSQDRQSRADALLTDRAVEDPLAILSDQEPDAWPICRKSKTGPDTGYTLATAVFELRSDAVAWRVYDDPKVPATHDGLVQLEALTV